MTLRHLGDQLVYEIRSANGATTLIDAHTGARLTPLDQGIVQEIALADFAGDASTQDVSLITEQNAEYRGRLPVWRVVLDDAEGTHLYVSPDTGHVVARRNDLWRQYDFFWMLHIMDYENRTDFNHSLIIIVSIASLILVITGVILIFYRVGKRDLRLPK